MDRPDNRAVYLIDLNYYIYSGHYAVHLSSRGKAIGGTYTTVKNLLRLMKMSNYVVAAIDSEYSFKKEKAKSYKSHRQPVPEIQYQREAVTAFLVTMGIPLAREYGYEADDIIATLTTHYSKNHRPSVIVGVDKDLCALVNKYCYMFNLHTGNYLDRDGVIKQYGVAPEMFEDFLALVGDVADGFRGVPGIGKVSALRLLHKYGSVRTLLEHPELVDEPYQSKLNKESSLVSLRESIILSALDKYVPNLEAFYRPKEHNFNKEAFNDLCDFHGFRSLKQK